MNGLRAIVLAGTLILGGFMVLHPQHAPTERVGPLPDGGFLLNSGWAIRPAGQQVPVDTFPMSSTLSPTGKYLLILNGGYNPPTISVVETGSKREVGRTPLPDAWLGLHFAPSGDKVYVGGGSSANVYELELNEQTGELKRTRQFAAVRDAKPQANNFIGDVAISPDAHVLYAANVYGDSISVINLESGMLIDEWNCGKRPYKLYITPGGRRVLETSWAEASLFQYDANSGKELGRTRVAAHPTDMLWINRPAPVEEGETSSNYIARLFIAAANTNSVYVFGVAATGDMTQLETVNVSTSPMHPLGMTPTALAIDKTATRLYVVCSDANTVAVADISTAHSDVLGFIPTGWYPTGVTALIDGQLVILNGKGLGSRANPDGPIPTRRNQPLYQGGPVIAPGYVAHIQTGTLSFLPKISDAELPAFTATVLHNSPYHDELIYGPLDDSQIAYFARTPDHASPIQHVIYVIKENRTYDQVLGDLEKANGDKTLNLFGEQITPNLHQLARQFVTFDNFYENADVSADGHNWANAAIAPDFTMKMWPNEYAHRSHLYAFEGGEPANTPPAGYIWDNALQAGLTVRDYGEWVTSIPLTQVSGPKQIDKIRDPALISHVDLNYRGFDLNYPDVDRAHEFVREWKQFDDTGQAPNLMIVRMGNDHTQGTRPGAPTPLAYAADNDYGVGQVVDAVSHSKLWSSTAIFVIEDDAQNGPDHVDSHRAPVWVLSPYTQRGTVDSTMYNQASVLRTMELILGLRPMTHFDAGARPIFGSFTRQPNTQPFTVITPKTSTTDRNPGTAVGAAESARMDFSDADKVDDDELTAVVWRAIKHSNPPPPTRSAFAR